MEISCEYSGFMKRGVLMRGSLDLFVLSEDQSKVEAWVWDHSAFSYTHFTTVASFITGHIVNVVPADLNYDGRLDVLLMTIGKDGKQLDMSLHLGEPHSTNFSSPRMVPPSGLAHPILLDSDGDMRLNLLGLDPDGEMRLWRNNDDTSGTFTLTAFQLSNRSPASQGGYVLAREGKLPQGAGQVSFADMDRDGTLDMVFPVCTSFSSQTGVGLDCAIHIAYNTQIPLCPSAGGISSGGNKCRSPGNLCVADDAYSIIPLSSILPDHDSLLLTDTTHNPPLPIPLHIGDANLDGFPDILAVAVGEGSVERVPVLLFSVPGKEGPSVSVKVFNEGPNVQQLFGAGGNVTTAALARHHRRFFKSVKHGTEPLAQITDARGVAFVDLDEDGTLDILVQRNGAQTGSRIAFIQNNFFQDAFFLKAIVLNGACPSGICEKSSGKYKVYAAVWSYESWRFVQVYCVGYSRRTVCCVWHPTPSNRVPSSPRSLCIPRARPNEQLYRIIHRRLHISKISHHPRRRDSQLQADLEPQRRRDELAARVVFEAR
ncbi:hypothetical protein RSAG8_13406, partial [Rhizoctonia solani AG-8 WAC10335]